MKRSVMEVDSTALFDMDKVRMDSPRLKLIKKYDIQTHHAPWMDDEECPWMAVLMEEARKVIRPYQPSVLERENIPEMMAGYCGLIDHLCFFGLSEKDVEDQAIAYMSNVALQP